MTAFLRNLQGGIRLASYRRVARDDFAVTAGQVLAWCLIAVVLFALLGAAQNAAGSAGGLPAAISMAASVFGFFAACFVVSGLVEGPGYLPRLIVMATSGMSAPALVVLACRLYVTAGAGAPALANLAAGLGFLAVGMMFVAQFRAIAMCMEVGPGRALFYLLLAVVISFLPAVVFSFLYIMAVGLPE